MTQPDQQQAWQAQLVRDIAALEYRGKSDHYDGAILALAQSMQPWGKLPVLQVTSEQDLHETHSGEPIFAPITLRRIHTYVLVSCDGKTERINVNYTEIEVKQSMEENPPIVS